VLLNLLANARDALDERAERERDELDRAQPKLAWLRTYAGEDAVVMEVEDNGMGVREQDLEMLFQPFFTTKDPDRGTGLGLSIAYAIVKDHGGQITCQSSRGAGSVFRVRLPAAAAAAEAAEPSVRPPPASR